MVNIPNVFFASIFLIHTVCSVISYLIGKYFTLTINHATTEESDNGSIELDWVEQ